MYLGSLRSAHGLMQFPNKVLFTGLQIAKFAMCPWCPTLSFSLDKGTNYSQGLLSWLRYTQERVKCGTEQKPRLGKHPYREISHSFSSILFHSNLEKHPSIFLPFRSSFCRWHNCRARRLVTCPGLHSQTRRSCHGRRMLLSSTTKCWSIWTVSVGPP